MYINHMFDRYVTIFKYIPATPTTEDAWELDSTVSGRIRPMSGNERFAGGKLTVVASHRIYTHVLEIHERDRLIVQENQFDMIVDDNDNIMLDDIGRIILSVAEIDGQMYEIVLVSRPSESNHLEIDAVRIA